MGSWPTLLIPSTEIIDSIRSDLDAAGAPTADLEVHAQAVITAAQGDSEEDLAAAIEFATSS